MNNHHKTFGELFKQIQIDADNGIIFNQFMYLLCCKEIHDKEKTKWINNTVQGIEKEEKIGRASCRERV